MLILKIVKVVYFDTLLQVLILKGLRLHKNCATVSPVLSGEELWTEATPPTKLHEYQKKRLMEFAFRKRLILKGDSGVGISGSRKEKRE